MKTIEYIILIELAVFIPAFLILFFILIRHITRPGIALSGPKEENAMKKAFDSAFQNLKDLIGKLSPKSDREVVSGFRVEQGDDHDKSLDS